MITLCGSRHSRRPIKEDDTTKEKATQLFASDCLVPQYITPLSPFESNILHMTLSEQAPCFTSATSLHHKQNKHKT